MDTGDAPINRYAHLHKWPPGVSGNPLGQGSGRVTLARYIRQRSQDGQVYIDFLTAVMNGEPLPFPGRNGRQAAGPPPRPNIDQRLRACELLLARGWGLPKEILELHQDDHAARAQRLTLFASMPEEDLATIRGLLEKHIAAQTRAAPVEATRRSVRAAGRRARGRAGRAASPARRRRISARAWGRRGRSAARDRLLVGQGLEQLPHQHAHAQRRALGRREAGQDHLVGHPQRRVGREPPGGALAIRVGRRAIVAAQRLPAQDPDHEVDHLAAVTGFLADVARELVGHMSPPYRRRPPRCLPPPIWGETADHSTPPAPCVRLGPGTVDHGPMVGRRDMGGGGFANPRR